MKKIAFAVITATAFAGSSLSAGNVEEPVMEEPVIVAETASSSANQAEVVALSLTALVFVTALVAAH